MIGIPFKPDGRDRNGCDCYGLVRLALRELAGIELPDKQYGPDGQERAAVVAQGLPGWVPVDRPRRFDIAVFNTEGGPHVGLCMGSGKFLHVREGGRSRIERFGPLWAVAGFYRFQGTP